MLTIFERTLLIYSRFTRSGTFLRNVTTMLAGNATAQAIAFLAAPVITRLYAPDDFGEMTYVSSLIAIFSVFACMRYESAIVLPKEEGKAFNIFILCVLSVVTISMLLFLIVAFWGENLVYILNNRGYGHGCGLFLPVFSYRACSTV